jgi:DNA (cytosine-5)-methyltransferase 1
VRLLDLFCGAGGAAKGYHRAGFDEIVGVDIHPQPNYPFTFIQGDALRPPVRLEDFDLIHASPPCQHFTRYRNAVKDITDRYENSLPQTLAMLEGFPYVIENVPNAPIRADAQLCGSMFGLDVMRHRWFQTSFPVISPACNHKGWTRRFKSSTGRKNLRFTIEIGSWDEKLEDQKVAMGVDWPISTRELSEAIPPAYTEYLGTMFLGAQRFLKSAV